MTKIKICGLSRERDIDYVNQYLPDYAGFVLNVPRSRRNLSPEKAEGLVRLLNPGIQAVGVVVDQPLDRAIELLNRGFLDALQLHGSEDEDYIQIVLDSGQGSGECFDWDLLQAFDRPYFLAGGLGPQNVVKAVKQLHPYGIDLSSGIETDGVKDKGKLSSVIASVRKIK